MGKSPEAFRTISEVSSILETPAHVLRFWESKFPQIKPVKRAGGRRYYRPDDIALLGGIKSLLHEQGVAIRGVQKLLREQGSRHVAALSPLIPEGALGEGPGEGPGGIAHEAVIGGPWAIAAPAPAPDNRPADDRTDDAWPADDRTDGRPMDDPAPDGLAPDDVAPPRAATTPTFIQGVLERTLARFDAPDAGIEADPAPRAAGENGSASDPAVGSVEAAPEGGGSGEPPPGPSAPPRRPRPEGEVSLAWLAERLAEADPALLRARAGEIAPLVRRLREVRAGMGA